MKKIFIISTIIIIICIQFSFGQLPNGEKTFLHTQTAKTFSEGRLGLYTNMNFYSKVGDFLADIKPTDFESVNYWLVAGNLVATYGIMDHLDVTVGLRLYQDTHYDNEFNLPDDVFITLKTGSYLFGRNHFSQGFLTSIRLPSGEVHNYPFTEYTTNSVQYSFIHSTFYTFYVFSVKKMVQLSKLYITLHRTPL